MLISHVLTVFVIKDAVFDSMSYPEWDESIRPKVQGSWHLHTMLPRSLDFFVMLSSVCGIIGNPSQANYAAGNTYQDALARHRVAQGEKAVSLDLGLMLSEGVVAESEVLLKRLRALGVFMEVAQDEFFALLDHYCNPKLDLLNTQTCQLVVGLEVPAVLTSKGLEVPDWLNRPFLADMHNVRPLGIANASTDITATSLLEELKNITSTDDASELIQKALKDKLSQMLHMQAADIDVSRPMHTFGIDSLFAVDVRNWFRKTAGHEISVFDILSDKAVKELCHVAATDIQNLS